jgi:predicted lipoprotein with Yx(FWY)xxD motif
MRGRALAAVTVGLVLVAAACGDDDSSSSSNTTTTAAAEATTTTAGAAETTTTAATSGAATLSLATVGGNEVLVDGEGMSVYLFVPDGTSTTSQVPADIQANWPPVTVTGSPTAADGVDSALLTAEAQPDGSQQVAYNGHLLYTFIGDAAPGDGNGQGLGGVWFLLDSSGNAIAA